MTLTELKYVIAVAREHHFGRAAESCGVSQPSLSVAIRKLEEELGVSIFERRSSEIALTPVGEKIVEQAQRVMEESRRIADIAHEGQDPLSGPIKLGVIYTIGPYLLPELIRELSSDQPNMPVYLEENFTSELLERLKTGQLDLAIMADTIADTGFMTGNVLNVEALLSLDPDVVLVNAPDKRTLEAVRNAGLPAVAVSATKWDYDVEKTRASWMRILGELFPDAHVKPEIVAAESERLATLVSDRLTNLEEKDRPSVLFLVRLSPTEIVTSGKHFFGQYWANAAGGRNAAEHITLQNANAVITMEDVHALDPDVILLTNFTTAQPEDLLENRTEGRDWQGLRAVEKKAVHKMPLGLYRSFTPSIDSPLTLLWMAKTLHPERFADVDLKAETKRFYKTVFGRELTDEQVERIYRPAKAAGVGAARAR